MELSSRARYCADIFREVRACPTLSSNKLTFVSSVLPGIAFSLDLIETTNQYGVAEVLLSSFMAAFIFSVFGAQPLTIAGVTGACSSASKIRLLIKLLGPITVFNKTIYDIIEGQEDAPVYLHFIGWVYLWAAILHWITAILNCMAKSSHTL